VLSFPPLPLVWPGFLVAAALMDTARARQLDALETPYVEVLSAILPKAAEPDRAAWADWLHEHKDYLYVAMCDEELCGPVTAALLPLFALLREDCLPTFSTLLSSLRMVCENAPAHCAQVANSFLVALYGEGEPFASALKTMVQNFEGPMRESLLEFVARVEA